PKQVQTAVAGPSFDHSIEQDWVLLELTVFDHQIDLGDVHINDASSADVEMADFAVAHLASGQAHVAPAGVNQSVGKFGQQAVVIRFARQRDGVRVGRRRIAPAIEDDQDERFGNVSHKLLANNNDEGCV